MNDVDINQPPGYAGEAEALRWRWLGELWPVGCPALAILCFGFFSPDSPPLHPCLCFTQWFIRFVWSTYCVPENSIAGISSYLLGGQTFSIAAFLKGHKQQLLTDPTTRGRQKPHSSLYRPLDKSSGGQTYCRRQAIQGQGKGLKMTSDDLSGMRHCATHQMEGSGLPQIAGFTAKCPLVHTGW